MNEVTSEDVDSLYKQLDREAESGGYHLNTNKEFTKDLIKSLLVNEKRYGYRACPCRLASGKKEEDIDVICPCDYRDPDLNQYGTCYCALYVSQEIKDGKKQVGSIPERRPPKKDRDNMKKQKMNSLPAGLSKPVWRCKVCGYLCARDEPPEICPICKVKKDRFELFIPA